MSQSDDGGPVDVEAENTDDTENAEEEGTLLLYVDPSWAATDEQPQPPMDRIVGGWMIVGDDTTGEFIPNPDYVPASPDSPTDPVDGVLRELLAGEVDGDEVLAMLDTVHYGVALDHEGAALIVAAPDGVSSVAVTTAPQHRDRVGGAAEWIELSLAELAVGLPSEGVDVLLNPGGPASLRLLAEVVRDAARAALVGEAAEQPDGVPDEG